ncbi:MAG: glycoside hydrolase family 38 C-terminal domain-containing protein [Kiritimatiellia bacterium]|nr:glycoside hydrolase family 38 C-terminal domain-containing protein [Kiritimatiellia bacterium]
MKKKVRVNTFAAFHYDVAYQKTFSGYLDKTFRIIDAGLMLLEQYPAFIFVIEQVLIAREYVRRNPSVLPAMRRLACERRLIFAPGMFTMPDSNLPGVESFVRNYLIGRQWLKDTLGVEPKVCWMADIFGHHPQLPQLAKLCGYIGYIFERGKRDGDDVVFWWEGLDGSRILTHWEIDTYFGLGIPMSLPQRGMKWMADYADEVLLDPLRDNSKTEALLSAMGGDFREPNAGYMKFIREYNRLPRGYQLAFGSPERYFEEIHRDDKRQLPVLKSDFNPLMQGTYSSRIRLKQANRRLENLAFAVGMLEGSKAFNLHGVEPYSERLWEKIAWNSFHDIICGSLADDALREALRDYAQTEAEAREHLSVLMMAKTKNQKRSFRAPSDYIVALFNPLPYMRDELVEIPVKTPDNTVNNISVRTSDGGLLESQLIYRADEHAVEIPVLAGEKRKTECKDPAQSKNGMASVLVRVHMPPTSIRSVGLRLNGKALRRMNGVLVKENSLENDRLRAVLGPNGTIISLVDKDNDTEMVRSGEGLLARKGMNNFIIQTDLGDLWTFYRQPTNGSLLYTAELHDPMPHLEAPLIRKGDVAAHASDADSGRAEIRIVERGPLRAKLEIRYPEARLTTSVSLAQNEKTLRFETRLVTALKRWRLRVAFPTTIRDGIIRRSIPGGFVRQPEGEYPAQDWMDYADGEKGLCLLNRGLPGNNVTDGIMFLSLFRAVAMENIDPQPWYEEGVEHVFEYALCPFGPKDRDYHPARLGVRFNQAIHYAYGRDNGLVTPELGPLCSMKGEGAELMYFGQGKNGTAELRLYESEGHAAEIELVFSGEIRQCLKTDFNGRILNRKDIKIRGARVIVRLRPFEIVNLRLS